MVELPAETPVRAPLEMTTPATPGLRLLQVPPGTALLSTVAFPAHSEVVPVMGAIAFTVISLIAIQPNALVYEMLQVPAAMPETMPDAAFIVAIPGFVLAQVPPVTGSV